MTITTVLTAALKAIRRIGDPARRLPAGLLPLMLALIAATSRTAGSQTIFEASRDGNLAAVQNIIDADPSSVNALFRDGSTALNFAADHGSLEVARYLVAHGANVNSFGDRSDHWTPLFCAARNNHPDIIKFLLDNGAVARARASDYNTALHWAAAFGCDEVARMLVGVGVDVNARQSTGWTPICSAANGNNTQIIRYLIAHGADVNAVCNNGDTALHIAARGGQSAAVSILIGQGAKLNVQNIDGNTPLHSAAQAGQSMALRILVIAGANVKVVDKQYHTARDVAGINLKTDCATLLDSYERVLNEEALEEKAHAEALKSVRKRYAHWSDARARTHTIYRNAFAADRLGPEWTTAQRRGDGFTPLQISMSPNANKRFLGDFGSQFVVLNLKNLPNHREASVSFDLIVIGGWDGGDINEGPDIFSLDVAGGPVLIRTTFCNTDAGVGPGFRPQAFPGEFPRDHYFAWTGSSEHDSLGYFCKREGANVPADAVYRIGYTFPHTGKALSLDFSAYGLDASQNERWALANVRVSVDKP